jgi:transketolase
MNHAPLDLRKLASVSSRIRGKLVELSHAAGTPHLASALSCVDILTAAYWGVLRIDCKRPDATDRDRFVLSKGHAATALYATLAERGIIGTDLLDTFGRAGGMLAEQPSPKCVPGVEWATGSLGHGLGAAIGMALAGRILQREYRVFVLLSDGECNEGSVWEAALFAPQHQLANVTVIIDYNKWQATGRSEEIMSLKPLKAKWEAFGWDAYETDGHDLSVLIELMRKVPAMNGKPVAIVAHTVKGKGISFMENDNNWHYRIPKAEEVSRARKELGLE